MMENEVILKIIRDARDLISDESRWTRGSFARDRQGYYVQTKSPEAVCWCAVGALIKCIPPGYHEERVIQAFQAAVPGHKSITYINDERGHAATLETFDAVILKLEARDEGSY